MIYIVAGVGALATALCAALLLRQRAAAAKTIDDLAAMRREMDILLRLSKDVEVAHDYYAIQVAVGAAIRDRLGLNNTWMFLASPDDPATLELLSFAGDAEGVVRTYTSRLPTKGDAMIEEIITSHRAVVVENARTDPRTNKDFVEKENINTLLNVSMRMADRLVGALGMGTYGEEGFRHFTPDEVAFTEAVAARTAVALDRLRQFLIRQQEHEARLKLVKAIEFAADGILVADADQKVTYVNPAYERLFGVAHAEAVGKPMAQLPCLGGNPRQLAAIQAAAERGDVWTGKLEMAKEGTDMILEATLSPVGEPGKSTGYVGVLRDITGEEALNQAKDYFVRITAHEMRTPLTKLNLCTHLIQEAAAQAKLGQEELITCGQILGEAYGNLKQITENTTVLTEMAMQREELPRRSNIAVVLEECLRQTAERIAADNRNLALRREITLPDGGETAIAAGHLAKALMELLSNAVKYTPDGGAVAVNARIEGEAAIIEIIDGGPGISEAEKKRLFTPFYSLQQSDKHSSGRYKFMGGGLGLGLTVAKMILDYYGGTIRLEEMPGKKGTRQILTIPLAA